MSSFNFSPLESSKKSRKKIVSKVFTKRRWTRWGTNIQHTLATSSQTLSESLVTSTSRILASGADALRVSGSSVFHLTVIFVLLLMIVQPSKFEVLDAVTINSSKVYAQIGGDTGQDEGALQFDLLTPGGDIGGEILYTVRPGDSLGMIAKNFGTTVSSLTRTNNNIDPDALSPGQKISIQYNRDEVIYEVEQKMTVAAFAEKYNLPPDDVLTLNFIDSQEVVLEEGQQLFLELTRDEAEKKGLRQQPVYIKPAGLIEELPFNEESRETIASTLFDETIVVSTGSASEEMIPVVDEVDEIPTEPLVSTGPAQQTIISPADTADILDANERALKDAEEERLAKEAETKRIEEEKIRKAEEAKQEAKRQKEKEARDAELRKKETARQTAQRRAKEEKEEAERKQRQQEEQKRAQEKKRQQEIANSAQQNVISAEETTQKIEEIVTCGQGKCLHKGKCWKLPSNAQCVPEDDANAWTCSAGYVETRTGCITEEEKKKQDEKKKKVATQPVKKGTVSQRYFNPYNDGYSNGRGGGHCTHYSGRYRWKNYGIMTNWRGNGGQRYRNASAAGRQVGKTPEVGSIFVADSGSGRWSAYGHVGIVLQVDRASNSMLVEDMNYAGRYIVTQRWMPLNSAGLIGYVYPRKK